MTDSAIDRIVALGSPAFEQLRKGGYDRDQVDAYVRLVAQALSEATERYLAAEQRAEELDSASNAPVASTPVDAEAQITEILTMAKAAAAQLRTDAQTYATELKDRAVAAADLALAGVRAEIAAAQHDLDTLRQRARDARGALNQEFDTYRSALISAMHRVEDVLNQSGVAVPLIGASDTATAPVISPDGAADPSITDEVLGEEIAARDPQMDEKFREFWNAEPRHDWLGGLSKS